MEKPNQLIFAEEQFKIMADTVPALIWLSGPDSSCHFFNEGWLKFTGRTQAQEYGNGWTEGVHPDDLQYRMESFASSFEQRQAYKAEYRLKRHDGQYRWLLDNSVPRYAQDGSFVGYIGSCVDIDEKVQTEKLKTELISTACHDLKTPLTTMKVYTQLLQAFLTPETYPKQSGFINKLADQITRLTGLINQLSDASKRHNRPHHP